MAVHTSNLISVAGPRTPYALYPELSSQQGEHKGFLWRAGLKRPTETRTRFTSEYQRQYQPISMERYRETADRRKERKEKKVVADVRDVFNEVERPVTREDRPASKGEIPVERQRHREEATVVREKMIEHRPVEREVLEQERNTNIPDRPLETVGGQKRSNKIKEKNSKRSKKDQIAPFPLSEYQSQFQAWDPLSQDNCLNPPPVYNFPNKHSSYESQPPLVPAPVRSLPPSTASQQSPRRWSSEYQSNYSLCSQTADVTAEVTNPWYQLVKELRERARMYRDRGRSSSLEQFQLPLSGRYTIDSARSALSRDEVTVPMEMNSTPQAASAVDQLGNSLSKLNVTTPHLSNQLTELEQPHSCEVQRVASCNKRVQVENHKSPSPVVHETIRTKPAVPPIDISRLHSNLPSNPSTYGSPSYLPAPTPRSALSHADTSLQTQLFKHPVSTPEPGRVSIASVDALASNTLERAKHRQRFWK